MDIATTKLLVTLGPSSMNEETVRQCAKEGVYLFRINLSHTPLEAVEDTIRKVRQWTDVPICLDTEGAQLRTQHMKDDAVILSEGDSVRIDFGSIEGDEHNISFTPVGSASHFEVGDKVRLDFDEATLKVASTDSDHCIAIVALGGRVGSNKAADTDRDLNLASITAKDNAAIKIGKKLGVRNFALSFAETAQNVKQMREFCGTKARIISKIESRPGLANLSDILAETDDLLIDRGDLSRQIPLAKIPFLQRRIISTANLSKTPVHVATNLLESMVYGRSPSRAELNDVVSTLLMGANGLVLAAETAIGKFPLETVRMVRALTTEVSKWTPGSSIDDILNS